MAGMIELTDEELNLALRLCVDNLKARMPLTSSFSFGDTKGSGSCSWPSRLSA